MKTTSKKNIEKLEKFLGEKHDDVKHTKRRIRNNRK